MGYNVRKIRAILVVWKMKIRDRITITLISPMLHFGKLINSTLVVFGLVRNFVISSNFCFVREWSAQARAGADGLPEAGRFLELFTYITQEGAP